MSKSSRARLAARQRARRQALQILYQSEISGVRVARVLADRTYCTVEVKHDKETGEETLRDDVPLEDRAASLALGVDEHRRDIDAALSAMSANWAVSRMPVVDRNILRIAAYEMEYDDDVPVPVAINEAVELARAFAGEESTRFINGVLGSIADAIESRHDSNLPVFDASKLPDDQVIDPTLLAEEGFGDGSQAAGPDAQA